MRRFELWRHRDISGVSGTGVVAHGTEYIDGVVTLHWFGDWPCTTVWPCIDAVVAIHGHGGATEVRWLDPPPETGETRSCHDLVSAAASSALVSGGGHGAPSQ